MQTELPPDGEQALPVCTHQVRHRLAAEPVAMKPNAAIEGEAHPVAAALKLTIGTLYVQEMRPSTVAVPTGAALPENK